MSHLQTNTNAHVSVALGFPSHSAFPGDTVRQGRPATREVGELIAFHSEMDWKSRLAERKGEASKVTSTMADTLLPLGLFRKGTRFLWDCQLPLAHWGWSR